MKRGKVKPNYIRDQKARDSRTGRILDSPKTPDVHQLVPFDKIVYKPETTYRVFSHIDKLEKRRLKIFKDLARTSTLGMGINSFPYFVICVPVKAYKAYQETKNAQDLFKTCAEFIWEPSFMDEHVFLDANPIHDTFCRDGYVHSYHTGEYEIEEAGHRTHNHWEYFLTLLNQYKEVVAKLETWRGRV